LGAGQNGSAFVQLRDPGSLWQLEGDLVIGENSLSEFRVIDGGTVNNINGTIGKNFGGANSIASVLDGAQWNNSGELVVGLQGNGGLVIATGGSVSSSSGIIGLSARGLVAIDGVGSAWISSGDLIVGDEGEAELNILTGAMMSNVNAVIGKTTDSISAEVAVNGQWSNSGNLTVSSGGNASLEISGGGLVTVGGTTAIGTNGTVSLSSGRFEFGTTTLPEFNRITATGGSMSGIVTHSDFTDVASLTSLQNSDVDLNDVTLENSGTLFGNASLNTSLSNTTNGEVEAAIGERLRFTGADNKNFGEFNLFGGQIRFDENLSNSDTGFIGGHGVLVANGGLTNEGVMAFSGSTSILGDVDNVDGGQIVTSGGATTTFFDDLIHNGGEIRTSEDSKTVIFGAATGAGAYTGAGTVFFEGDLRPGNSPAVVDFEGSVVFGDSLFSEFELGGTLSGQFDRLNIDQDLFLGGELAVSLIDGFQLGANQEFLIADVGGNRFGTFDGLGEGSLVGNFDGRDLFITYNAGSNGSGVALFTPVPEPGTIGLLGVMCLGLAVRRRKRR
jgi:T5SS/PEP-CTERM-associated repeat protein